MSRQFDAAIADVNTCALQGCEADLTGWTVLGVPGSFALSLPTCERHDTLLRLAWGESGGSHA